MYPRIHQATGIQIQLRHLPLSAISTHTHTHTSSLLSWFCLPQHPPSLTIFLFSQTVTRESWFSLTRLNGKGGISFLSPSHLHFERHQIYSVVFNMDISAPCQYCLPPAIITGLYIIIFKHSISMYKFTLINDKWFPPNEFPHCSNKSELIYHWNSLQVTQLIRFFLHKPLKYPKRKEKDLFWHFNNWYYCSFC